MRLVSTTIRPGDSWPRSFRIPRGASSRSILRPTERCVARASRTSASCTTVPTLRLRSTGSKATAVALWLPFLDATSGAATYGGGRYLYDTIKGADLGVGASSSRARLQLRVQPVVRLRRALVVPAVAAGKPAAVRGSGGRRSFRLDPRSALPSGTRRVGPRRSSIEPLPKNGYCGSL